MVYGSSIKYTWQHSRKAIYFLVNWNIDRNLTIITCFISYSRQNGKERKSKCLFSVLLRLTVVFGKQFLVKLEELLSRKRPGLSKTGMPFPNFGLRSLIFSLLLLLRISSANILSLISFVHFTIFNFTPFLLCYSLV